MKAAVLACALLALGMSSSGTDVGEEALQRPDLKLTRTLAALTVISATLAVGRAQAQLPDPGLTVDRSNTALVLADPQNDFLSPKGVTWGLVGKSVTANHTVENIESLLKTAKQTWFLVFVSPHYYYPTDHEWKFARCPPQISPIDRRSTISAVSMRDPLVDLTRKSTGDMGAHVLARASGEPFSSAH